MCVDHHLVFSLWQKEWWFATWSLHISKSCPEISSNILRIGNWNFFFFRNIELPHQFSLTQLFQIFEVNCCLPKAGLHQSRTRFRWEFCGWHRQSVWTSPSEGQWHRAGWASLWWGSRRMTGSEERPTAWKNNTQMNVWLCNH